jgi:hypothetical protein
MSAGDAQELKRQREAERAEKARVKAQIEADRMNRLAEQRAAQASSNQNQSGPQPAASSVCRVKDR